MILVQESLSAISSYSGRARKLAPSLLLPQTVARRNWDGDEEVMSYREREQLAKRRKPEPPGVPGKLHDMRTIFLTAPVRALAGNNAAKRFNICPDRGADRWLIAFRTGF